MTSDMRRSCGWTARRIDPDFTAVHAQLLLPDRYATLHFLDHVAAGLEHLGPMRRRRGDRDARLSHGDLPSRCRTAMRASGQRARASVRSRTNSASTISSYAEYSIAVTPRSSGPLRTVPRNTQVPPHAGDETSAIRRSREIGERVT